MAADGTDEAESAPGAFPHELYEATDERFVPALREVRDAPRLAAFAADWWADARPEARRLLLQYLDETPNAPGHEGLVKRLFKLAEAAGDDEVMAHFLVLADRLIEQRGAFGRRLGGRLDDRLTTAAEAAARAAEWTARGWAEVRTIGTVSGEPRWYYTTGRPPIRTSRNSTLPRPDDRQGAALAELSPDQIAGRRWFTVASRRYLQRRVWRYFGHLGRTDPERFVAAATTALTLYRDADTATGLNLLDRFGLMHLLFEASPALRLTSAGWVFKPGSTLADLAPAPAFVGAWRDHPEAILSVLREGQSRLVGRWAWRLIEVEPDRFRALTVPDDWRACLAQDDAEVVRGVVGLLDSYGPEALAAATRQAAWALLPWLARPASRGVVAEFLGRVVESGAVNRLDAIRLAMHRAEPLARLGWRWVVAQGVVLPHAAEEVHRVVAEALPLIEAECPALRPTILPALREALSRRDGDRADLAALFLHSRHADARAEGLAWLRADDTLWHDAELWLGLTESPYPDIRAVVATVEPPVAVDPSRLDDARAAVLLAPRGQARAKPATIRQVVRRLEALAASGGDAAEVDRLLALLADLTRSSRVPERRAALAALVGWAERWPQWAGRVEGLVPALQLGGGSAIVPG